MKVLFFSPHSAVWIHAFPEALVAESLAQAGHEIVYVGCGRLLRRHCIAMIARGVPFAASPSQKARICSLCDRNKRILRNRLGLDGIDLAESLEDADLLAADELAASVTPQDCLDLVVDDVAVGRIASYELLINSKKTELNFKGDEWQRYQASIWNCIVVLRVMRRILDRARPDRIVLYNALYSVNRIVCRLAEIRGIPQYFLHAGDNLSNRLQTLILARDHAFSYYARLRDKWTELQYRPAPIRAMRSATDHFLEVARGRSPWAYSAAPAQTIDLRKRFGIEPARKILCATMSSDDERFSGELIGALPADMPLVFPRQVDWIRTLVRYVAERKDLSLIVRVHPREFPNKREAVLSEHAKMLQVALTDLPGNVKVNWPTDNISLYDLANIADVFTNAWSSAGKEMAWLGLPVVLYSADLTLYPADLNYVGNTQTAYLEQIEQALRDGWDAERIRRTYRWCTLEYDRAALDIADSFSRSEYRSFMDRAASRLLREVLPSREQVADCRRRSSRLRESDRINRLLTGGMSTMLDLEAPEVPVTAAQETAALKEEVKRLLAGLYPAAAAAHPDCLASRLRKFAFS